MDSAEAAALASLALFAGGAVKGLTGLGLPLIAVPFRVRPDQERWLSPLTDAVSGALDLAATVWGVRASARVRPLSRVLLEPSRSSKPCPQQELFQHAI